MNRTHQMAHILIVEDSHAQAVALRQILQAAGFTADMAMNGESALERARTTKYDLILSDVLMPGISGYELCEAIKSDARTRSLPIILLTNLRDPSDVLRGLASGADSFIVKPYDEQYLLGRIRAILTQHTTAPPEPGPAVQLAFHGKEFAIRASKEQILSYLLSTYDDFVRARERESQSRKSEVSLRDSLRFLQSALDALSACIAILDESGVITAVNSSWRHAGTINPLVSARWGMGTNYLTMLETAAREGSDAAAQIALGIRSVMTQRRDSFQLEYRGRGGEQENWFALNVTRFPGDGPVRVVVAHENITDRKRAEAALRESQRAMQTLMANLPGMAYRCAADEAWTVRFVSEGCEDLTGYVPRDFLIGRKVSFSSLVHPLDRDRVSYLRRAALRAGVPFRIVYRIVTQGGEVRWVWEHGRGVGSPSGQILAVEGILTDISKRKLAETAIAEEAQISAALARVGRELIAVAVPSVLLERLAQLSAEALGCDFCHVWLLQAEDQALHPVCAYGDSGEQWEAARLLKVPRDDLGELLARLASDDVFREALPSTTETPLTKLLEQSGVTQALYVALRRGDGITGVLIAGHRGRRDGFEPVVERLAHGLAHLGSLALETARLVEELDRANRFKSDFLAAMSHELRTPLNVVIGYNSLLLEEAFGPLNPEQADTSRRIDKNARELLELVSATLDLTRFDARRVPMNLEQVDVGELMAEVGRETAPLLNKPRLTVDWHVAPKLPAIYTDPLKLRMALKNLIGNAIKFTDEGKVDVFAAWNAGGIEFTVQDTGIGIPRESLALIFEPFQQAHRSSERRGGAGLGLYLVRRIVDMLGGHIRVESEVGRGSTFRFWLPLQPALRESPPPQSGSLS